MQFVLFQPKIDLKTFGEGKDLNYVLEIDTLPEIKLKSFQKYKSTEYKIKIEDKIINEKLKEMSLRNKQFEDKTENQNILKNVNDNDAQFLMLANKFNEAVEVILELSDKVEKLEKNASQDKNMQKNKVNTSSFFKPDTAIIKGNLNLFM